MKIYFYSDNQGIRDTKWCRMHSLALANIVYIANGLGPESVDELSELTLDNPIPTWVLALDLPVQDKNRIVDSYETEFSGVQSTWPSNPLEDLSTKQKSFGDGLELEDFEFPDDFIESKEITLNALMTLDTKYEEPTHINLQCDGADYLYSTESREYAMRVTLDLDTDKSIPEITDPSNGEFRYLNVKQQEFLSCTLDSCLREYHNGADYSEAAHGCSSCIRGSDEMFECEEIDEELLLKALEEVSKKADKFNMDTLPEFFKRIVDENYLDFSELEPELDAISGSSEVARLLLEKVFH